MHKEDVLEREQFRLDIMISVGVSRMKKTSAVIVEPGAKVNSKYYCEHFLQRDCLPLIQATCGRHNWTLYVKLAIIGEYRNLGQRPIDCKRLAPTLTKCR